LPKAKSGDFNYMFLNSPAFAGGKSGAYDFKFSIFKLIKVPKARGFVFVMLLYLYNCAIIFKNERII